MDELYEKRLGSLVAFAKKHLYQTDSAIDIVHDALVKSIEYFNRPENKGRKIYERVIQYSILKLCKKHNKYSSTQKTVGLMTLPEDDNED